MYETIGSIDEPDIKLAGFSLWVLRRQYPDSLDYWDGNWLYVRATVEAPGAFVEASGPWLRIDELCMFYDRLVAVDVDLRGSAELSSTEPVLRLRLECGKLGHIRISVELTPDHLTQSHTVTFAIDQSYLPKLLADCRTLLRRLPIRGSPDTTAGQA